MKNLLLPLTIVRMTLSLAVFTALLAAAGRCVAQSLYSEDFDTDHTANWTPNPGTGNNDANFFFDYSTVGIPSAPHSSGGTTLGLKLRANYATVGALTGISVSPTGQSFTGNYRVTYDFWQNFNGNANGTGSGTTQLTGAGIGTDGITAQHAGISTMSSVWFAQTGDGGNSSNSKDYRAYSPVAGGGGLSGNTGVGYTTNSGVYAAGIGTTVADNANAYYVSLGGNTVPAAQTAITPTQTGTTAAGAPGFKWHTGEILKVGNTIKYSIDGLLVFTIDASSFTLPGGNIEFIQSDINSGVSTDPTAPTYAFGLFDNITVSNLPAVVSVTATAPIATEAGPTSGVFTLTRVGDTSSNLTVNYVLSGTATGGADYTTPLGTVTFAVGETSTNVAITPIDDTESEFLETVILTIAPDPAYLISGSGTATVSIIDNDVPTLTVAATQAILLEGFSSNRATLTITRAGLTNSALTVNLAYTGTAAAGADFAGPATAALAAGAVTTTFNLTPLNDSIYEGTETAIANVISNGLAYAVGSPGSATNSVIDDELPPGVVLFLDSFDTGDAATNWIVNSYSGGVDTYAQFGYDYSADGIPEAPSSTGTSAPRFGLKLRVNEVTNSPAAGQDIAGLSVSPTNGDFNGNYRLRFDLWMNFAGPLNTVAAPGTTQAASAGVGTTGYEAMWPSNSSISAGVWFSATSEGQANASLGDYNAYSLSTVYADTSGVYAAGTAAGVRDNLNAYYAPWNGVAAPAAQLALRPTQTGVTPNNTFGMAWHKVVITKRDNNVTWDIDGRRLVTMDTTVLPLSTNVFVGYHDPFASVTTNAAVQFGLFDNVRVETLGRPTITALQFINGGTQVQVDFAAEFEDTADLFELQTAGTVTGAYGSVAATITSLGGNQFRAVAAVGGTTQYYRVRRL